MSRKRFSVLPAPAAAVLLCAPAGAQSESTAPVDYVLGPDAQLALWTPEADELNGKTMRIEGNGSLTIPLIGSIAAMGLTPKQLASQISSKLGRYYQNPQVVVSVSEYRSQPVSVIGAVNNPGIHQLQGRKTLVEID